MLDVVMLPGEKIVVDFIKGRVVGTRFTLKHTIEIYVLYNPTGVIFNIGILKKILILVIFILLKAS